MRQTAARTSWQEALRRQCCFCDNPAKNASTGTSAGPAARGTLHRDGCGHHNCKVRVGRRSPEQMLGVPGGTLCHKGDAQGA